MIVIAELAMKHRRGRVSPLVIDRAKVSMPKRLAFEVISRNTGGAKRCDHDFPISHR